MTALLLNPVRRVTRSAAVLLILAGSLIGELLGPTTAVCADHQAPDAAKFAGQVKQLCRHYVAGFGSENTQLVYHHRLDGPRGIDALADPAEIAQGVVGGRALPYGYGSGIQDVALENGQLLFALCEAWEATRDEDMAELARWIFQGLRRAATVSPEPGFVPRGPHPDGKSYYKDSSRDQHAAMAEALWRYGRSGLATEADRRFTAGQLRQMAARMERNDWRIMVEDGSRVAHVGFGWKQPTSIGAVSLLSFLAMTADATGDRHWRQLYDRFSEEKDGFRWNELLHPRAADDWKPFTLYSNQFAQALVALERAERDPKRKQQVSQLLRRLAERAVQSDVLDPRYWRRLDWAGQLPEEETGRRLQAIGLSPAQPATAADVFYAFDPAWWRPGSGDVSYLGSKLCFGIPTAAFHKVLLAGDERLTAEVAPLVRRMVTVMLDHGHAYQRGENFNRSVVLGLLLLAADAPSGGRRGSKKPVREAVGL